MANFYSQYPAVSGGAAANPSVGTNGVTAPTSSTEVAGINPSGNLQPLQTSADGALIVVNDPTAEQHVIVDSSALPAGAATAANQATEISSLSTIATNTTGVATSANQTTEITHLTSIDSKFPAQGQALSSASLPVVLPASQITALTPPTTLTVTQPTAANLNATVVGSVSVSNFPGTQPISGSVTVLQPTGTNLHTVVDSGTVAVSSLPSIPAGSNAIGSVSVSNFPSTQPISATALPLPTGAATSANQTTEITQLTAINASTTRQGTLTDGSGSTSATANTSTQIFAANSNRKYLLIENLSSTAAIYVNFTSAATVGTGSFYLAPFGSLVMESLYISTEAVNVISSTASVPYSAKQG